MAQLRVLLYFATAADHDLEETAGAVLGAKGIYANPAIYLAPPVPKADVAAALDVFQKAMAAQAQGGTQSTAAKDQARAALVTLLRQLALYVQTVIQDNDAYGLAELLLSGFDAVSTNRAQQPLLAPSILAIDNSGTGQLTLKVKPSPNARMYEVQKQTLPNPKTNAGATGEWESAGLYTSTRGMVIDDLVPGQMYNFRVRAMGGSTGQSDWSDAVSHMSL